MEKSEAIRARFNIDYENFALKLDLTLPGKGVTVLFGHSGSGKTTCLRAMAGLEKLKQGYFSVDGEIWQNTIDDIFVPTHKREIGYVFQEAGLFPHLSVRGNLEFGLKRIPESDRKIGLDPVSRLLGISHLLDRAPERLSGGEKQRVAIARALLTSPKMLLMDEPLSALDNGLKSEILPYLERLQHELSMPIVYVTHSVEELARLADHIVLFHQGSILASDSATSIMSDPNYQNMFGEGAGSIFDTQVQEVYSDHITRLDAGGDLSFYIPEKQEHFGKQLRCRILANDVSVCLDKPAGTSVLNVVSASIVNITSTNRLGELMLTLRLSNGSHLLSLVTERSVYHMGLKAGKSIWAQIKAVAIC
ncbi:molybdenum ABC transporter ATP-binding protein [Vibrio sp. JC009]|uniref:molybdenum ABC transporter ATP-binding protein n=1 Tax=Vibrio sp. JC009 TaxID=2912314 RepID=UPI0023AF5EC9|nr:molybdenum ABC transporter ATP-binding protein [Vibrio sp. JC009]WED24088.1 molybdenum ABC transporter ATP-binding protein [Vibrio sp. JC009]